MKANNTLMRADRSASLLWRRHMCDRLATGLSWLGMLIVVFMLGSILWTLLKNGLAGLNVHLFTLSMAAPGQPGGLANAIMGSLIQTGLAILIGAPAGLMTGIYLAEYGAGSRMARIVRFVSDMLLSAPSILIGLFIYMMLVVPFGHFSGFSGAVALAILAMPIVVRTTEDMLRLVPVAMREAGIALGAPKWRVILFICVRAVRAGIMTGVLLSIARVAGETAPLLFTSLGNSEWSLDLGRPMASLPVAIYQYAGSAYQDWMQQAWTGALLVTLGVLIINIVVRVGTRGGRS
ncbi:MULTISPECIES: phosphate ABC transporter permease PstA [Acetobacter]|jgi:phosphate transport system permease protein|uniref:Phosphate transport system permease protein PstA n=1 Tax=Acetobacter lovaniensis TaxID=104100 RepID=A0A841QF41_9PROT|nr:phosphate ABC transporter permease PstA [Acetobacter lovaniensis]MBB6457090.1 phosphate transport system permease protein [Acetobacter lovaniensis]MCI1697673.1 phosphate ABC transporter permease PstA [Acetobacter lovaniensis]MCI1795314.1 phosphate ABC transporter permease PstA [Acetobacter lovaniensis]MCP1239566.1 phosphate ABC transporter permease PstA [Acetobacter lovaniensis]NHN81325.1 phosphate ABC transporter permease PstA [Acetobacter lovaniensis]